MVINGTAVDAKQIILITCVSTNGDTLKSTP